MEALGYLSLFLQISYPLRNLQIERMRGKEHFEKQM